MEAGVGVLGLEETCIMDVMSVIMGAGGKMGTMWHRMSTRLKLRMAMVGLKEVIPMLAGQIGQAAAL